MKIIRIILAAPFILLGAVFYKLGELISGQIYTRHEEVVRRNTIFQHGMVQSNKMAEAYSKTGGKGFRQRRRR